MKNMMVGLMGKLKDIKSNLTSLSPGTEGVKLEDLQAKKMAPHTEKFLWSLAVAEGIASK